MEASSSIFEYCYRDVGNFKTYGKIRLIGFARWADDALRECLDWDDQFVAEQVGIPPLCEAHWESVGDGPSDLDHAYHEFIALRELVSGEQELPAWGSLNTLVSRMRASSQKWDVSLSPNAGI